MSKFEEETLGKVECPCCCEMTADQDSFGRWICGNGCKLSGYYYCPTCPRLHFGSQGYCDTCINANC